MPAYQLSADTPSLLLFAGLRFSLAGLLLLAYTAFAIPFVVWVMRDFFRGLPVEVEECALLDGCSRFGFFWNVIVPLSKSPLAALAIFVFVGSWNDFLGPLVYLDSVDHYTLPVGVALFGRR